MFNRRLKLLLGILTAAAAALVVRLIDLQVLGAPVFQEQAAEAMLRPTRFIPAIRGQILDRYGRVLADDRPQWQLCVYYPVLADTQRYVTELAQSRARRGAAGPSQAELAAQILGQVQQTWDRVAQLTGVSNSSLQERQREIRQRVETIRAAVSRSAGIDVQIQEQEMLHPLVSGLDDQAAIKLRLNLQHVPWLQVQVANHRLYPNAQAFCHLLGCLGPVPPEVAYDPVNLESDVLQQYLPDEQMGYSGIEQLGEQLLRGRRGLVREDFHGRVLERVEPQPGHPLYLTIDADLQEQILPVLAQAVETNDQARGGGAAVVVLDVHTRHVLALVSYPTFDPNRRAEAFQATTENSRAAPLLARAISATYPPGSVVKPIVLAAGLSLGLVSPSDRKLCTGTLLDGVNAWHCWTYFRNMPPHGWVDASDAIKQSCNIYFFKLGQDVNPARLTDWLQRFGLGRYPGTDLIEERAGVVPTAAWLQSNRNRSLRPGDARNLAIGQGELTATPLQIANLAATIATGRWLPPTLLANDWRDRPVTILDVSQAHWAVIREGMFRAVNEPGGTAYRTARLENLELCGKTGSAQTGQPDRATHAWFMGFAPYRNPTIAIAVVIEHGGGGGAVAAPVARRIVELTMNSPHKYLAANQQAP
jgi:penicillin-binding protein 2